MKSHVSDDTGDNIIRNVLLRSSTGNFESNLNDLKSVTPIFETESLLTEYDQVSGRCALTPKASTKEYKKLKNIDVSLQDYLKKNYNSPGTQVGVQINQQSKDRDSYDVVVYAEKADLKNSYSGSWKGNFQIMCNKDVSVCGKVQVFAHVFETDHVQMACELDFPWKKVEISHIDADISMAIIREFEFMDSKVMKAMDSMYENISGDLKSLRKAIPITRSKFDWNVNSSRFRRTLSDGLHLK